MAELTGFGYRPGNSILHRMDVRVKLLCLVQISLAVLSAGPKALAVLTVLMIFTAWHTRLSLPSVALEIRYVFILFFLVFMARSVSTPGQVLWDFYIFAITREGVRQGGLVCWRLIVVLLVSLELVSTTRSSGIKAAVEWFLKPVPRIPEKRVATMLSLIVRLIPLVFNQARETADAQRARGVESRKNPVYRLIKFSIPMIRRSFESADKLAVAMEARCYSERRTAPAQSVSPADWMALCLVTGLGILAVVW